ncbi:hypothetical protein FCN78_08455 [Salinivibrio kushneri]|uniref:hypothetical protein n=1 Tax=Salinivibrio kushneri TaxID=1908198 RepID=UPI001055E701|nr:hypothetical protein [Salinivibrio kushneri]QCP02416.1 hypothetical protein FCN78_08455 [Salinivibrio kushneri]
MGNEQVAVHSVWIGGEVALDNPIDQRPILSEVNEIFLVIKKSIINGLWIYSLDEKLDMYFKTSTYDVFILW